MTKIKSQNIALIAVLALLPPIAATAQQQQPPRPDINKMAAQLNVPQDALKSCMPQPSKGQRPVRPDATKIAKCLKRANPKLTTAAIEKALRINAPERPRDG